MVDCGNVVVVYIRSIHFSIIQFFHVDVVIVVLFDCIMYECERVDDVDD